MLQKKFFITALVILLLILKVSYGLNIKGEFYGAKLGTVVDAIAKISNKNVIWSSEAIGKKDTPVYLNISKPTPIETVFNFVLKENGLTYVIQKNMYVIKPASETIITVPSDAVRYMGKEAFYNMLDLVRRNISATAELKVYPESNTIYIKDTKDRVEKIEKLVEKYTAYLNEEAKRLAEEYKKKKSMENLMARKEVVLSPEEFDEIEDELLTILSPNGKYEYDPNTGRLVVSDLRENIVKISKLIAKAQRVDIRTKCYYVKGIEPGELLLVIKQNFLSKYGTVFYKDKETTQVISSENQNENTKKQQPKANEVITSLPKICITDKPDILSRVYKSFSNILLDRPYQIAIEARIVQISSSFKRDLGIQWGFNRARFGFNSGPWVNTFQGGVNLGSGALTFDFNTGGYIPASTGALLNIGIIGDKTSIDLKLAALETVGKTKILSRPKVITIDGEKATISQGVEIPYSSVVSTSGATTASVQFKKAELRLEVIPRTTKDGYIIMDITLKQDVPDFGNAINGQPPIQTKEVKSKVIAKDGTTIVIGGVLEKQEGNGESGIPLLKSIPLIGWLFRNQYKQIDNRELLIFITPKIVYE
ncbi:MAG: pilus assembly protein PilQ [Persephonella sp.]|nr:MAG: pilus assembly protein PilQ [Persephonella sp.]